MLLQPNGGIYNEKKSNILLPLLPSSPEIQTYIKPVDGLLGLDALRKMIDAHLYRGLFAVRQRHFFNCDHFGRGRSL